jgi:hypothetical protein
MRRQPDVHAVCARLFATANKRVGRGVPQTQVAELENRLGVRLPASYKVFLQTFGWLEIGSYEVFGWGEDVPPHLDVLQITEWERHESGVPLPYSLVPIYNNGAGDLECLATHLMFRNECPVVAWYHEEGNAQEPDIIAESFTDWLEQKLNSVQATTC